MVMLIELKLIWLYILTAFNYCQYLLQERFVVMF